MRAVAVGLDDEVIQPPGLLRGAAKTNGFLVMRAVRRDLDRAVRIPSLKVS